MKRSKLFSMVWIPTLAILLARCDATIIGNPTQVGIDIEGSRSPLQNRLQTRAQSTGDLTYTRATIVLNRMRFRPFDDCDGGKSSDASLEFEGPFVVDLLNQTIKPSIDTLRIPAGRYCRIELRLDRLDDDEVPAAIDASDAIVENSLRIEGEDKDGRTFVATLDDDEEFKIENSTDGFFLGEHGDELFFIVFDLTAWLDGVDFSTATDSGGIIYVDKDNNESFKDAIRENVKRSAKLFRDQNGDGKLGATEKTSDDVLAEGD